MAEPPEMLQYTRPRWLNRAALVIFLLALAVLIAGGLSRYNASRALVTETNAASVPYVAVISPGSETGPRILVLPGNVKAFYEAPIYAQVSGYLKSWNADIGTQVKAGEVLAEISTPDLDQQLAQAKADLATALANEALSASTAKRWNALLAKDAVSQQDADEKNGDLAAKTAAVAAARAQVDGLEAQENFKRIIAPFNGVVTSRSTDIGALITVGAPNQTPLFTVDDEHRLRIYVEVPQIHAAEVKPGMTASFTVPEYPGQKFTATLTSTATALDPATGALLVEFQVDNAAQLLKPGDYAQMSIALPRDPDAVSVPASALMFRNSGMAVATVGPDDRVVFKPVTISRDLGTSVEIASGLSPADRIINNPPDALLPGDLVHVVHAGS